MRYFRGLYLTKVKDAISSYLIHKEISIVEINAYLEELSIYLQEKLQPVLAEYGIALLNFCVNDVSVPEDDSAVIKLKAALAKKAEMDIIGYNYRQQRSFDTMEKAAGNTGSAGDMMGVGMGLGMGTAMGGAVGKQFGEAAAAMNISEETNAPACPSCGEKLTNGKRFCVACGFDTAKTGRVLCPFCGEPLANADARFCPDCGKSLVKSCPECGSECAADKKFCADCGAEL